jgi:TonB family protein
MKPLTNNPEEIAEVEQPRLYRKRRQDSPGYWLQLVGGSLMVHGLLLTIALPLTARLSAGSQVESPTPVDFVELAPEATEPASEPPVETTAPVAPAEPPPAEPAPPVESVASSEIPDNAIGFESSPLPERSPTPQPSLSPEVLPSPQPSPPPEAQPEAPLEQVATPLPQPAPEPVASSTSEPQPAPSPEPQPEPQSEPQPEQPSPEPIPDIPPNETAAVSETPTPSSDPIAPESPADNIAAAPTAESPPQPPEPGLQTTQIDTPVPDVSERVAEAPSSADTANVEPAIANSPTAPTGVMVSLASYSKAPLEATGGDNTPEELDPTLEIARPVSTTTAFTPDPSTSACQVTPNVLNQAGTPIELLVTTDAQGGVMNVSVYKSSGNRDYDQLAACLVQAQWQFTPATVLNAGNNQRSAIANDALLLNLTINRN